MKKVLLLLALFSVWALVNAEDFVTNKQIADRIKAGTGKPIICAGKLTCKSPLLAKFYDGRHNSLAWVRGGVLTPSGTALIEALQNAYLDGLDPRVYHIKQIEKMANALQPNDSSVDFNTIANLDLTLSDGLLLYINNLVYGWRDGKVLYPNWPIASKKIDLIKAANNMVTADDINKILQDISPKYPEYMKLREKLSDYYQVAIENNGWEAIDDGDILKEGDKGDRVKLLQKRLYVSGELENLKHFGEFDSNLTKAVTMYQENNGIEADGTVGPQTLAALNVPVASRIRQIELNMDRMRFLPDEYPSRFAMVNIPDYSLSVFEDGKLTLLSPVVVGKPNKKTCVLNSQITTIEMNPFWNVPTSIAAKETLPAVKADPKFLKDNDIKVFKLKNGRYSEVDPGKIDWKKVKSDNLNYRFRQDPGDDNAMGKLKFKFANTCGIYLHDSPFPELFDETQRGFSHGCVRVGMPIDFADVLLAPNEGWSQKGFDTELASGKNKLVQLKKPLQLYIIYLTAWYDKDIDFVQFRPDIYGNDKLSLYPVYLQKKKPQQKEVEKPQPDDA
ncbi:MAG: hypothetical protein K0R14_1280 [Burkholderiales bacterium]|jgi:murein L,D-transpeptidase YcbB/YkuD|nr:hypothetical protein [Burkholderiales bacterium]